MQVDRPMYKWTDIMKLIVAFHNVANTCNKLNTLIVECIAWPVNLKCQIMCTVHGDSTSTPAFEKNLVPPMFYY